MGEAPHVPSSALLLSLLMAVSMTVWGGTWPAAKVITGIAAPVVLVFWRFVITTAAFLPILGATRSGLRVPLRSLPWIALAAAAMVLYNILFFAGLRLGLAGAGGVLVPTLSPVCTYLFLLAAPSPVPRRRPGLPDLLGLALGLAGGFLILRLWTVGPGDLLRSGNLFFLAAAAVWAALTILSQRAQRDVGFLPYSFLVYAAAAVGILPFAVPAGIGSVFGGTPAFWGILLYLGAGATAFATTVYFLCAARLGSRRASAFMFLVPVTALLLSWLFLGETPPPATWIGGALSIAAIRLINRRPPEGAAG